MELVGDSLYNHLTLFVTGFYYLETMFTEPIWFFINGDSVTQESLLFIKWNMQHTNLNWYQKKFSYQGPHIKTWDDGGGIYFCMQPQSSFNKIVSCSISILLCQFSSFQKGCLRKNGLSIPPQNGFWHLRLPPKYRLPNGRSEKETFLLTHPSIHPVTQSRESETASCCSNSYWPWALVM